MSTVASTDGNEADGTDDAGSIVDDADRELGLRINEVLNFKTFMETKSMANLHHRVRLEWNMVALAMLRRLRKMFNDEQIDYSDMRAEDK